MNKVLVYLYKNEYYVEVYNKIMTPYGEYDKNKLYTKEYIEKRITKIFGPSIFVYMN
jgi:hypothetical protein